MFLTDKTAQATATGFQGWWKGWGRGRVERAGKEQVVEESMCYRVQF